MKTKNKAKKSYKKLVVVASSLIIVSLSTALIWQYIQNKNSLKDNNNSSELIDNINLEPPNEEQKQTGIDQKQTNQTPPQISHNLVITAANVSNNNLQIRLMINGIISNNGTCYLKLKDSTGQETIDRQSQTYALPSTSTCAGFDVDTNELSPGKWTIEVTVDINGESLFNSKEIDI